MRSEDKHIHYERLGKLIEKMFKHIQQRCKDINIFNVATIIHNNGLNTRVERSANVHEKAPVLYTASAYFSEIFGKVDLIPKPMKKK